MLHWFLWWIAFCFWCCIIWMVCTTDLNSIGPIRAVCALWKCPAGVSLWCINRQTSISLYLQTASDYILIRNPNTVNKNRIPHFSIVSIIENRFLNFRSKFPFRFHPTLEINHRMRVIMQIESITQCSANDVILTFGICLCVIWMVQFCVTLHLFLSHKIKYYSKLLQVNWVLHQKMADPKFANLPGIVSMEERRELSRFHRKSLFSCFCNTLLCVNRHTTNPMYTKRPMFPKRKHPIFSRKPKTNASNVCTSQLKTHTTNLRENIWLAMLISRTVLAARFAVVTMHVPGAGN